MPYVNPSKNPDLFHCSERGEESKFRHAEDAQSGSQATIYGGSRWDRPVMGLKKKDEKADPIGLNESCRRD